MLDTESHKQSVYSLICRKGPTDIFLISKCGTRVAFHGLLLALHSPKMAKLLSETEANTAISLPFSVSIINELVSAMNRSQSGKWSKDLEEAAACLGILVCQEVGDDSKMEFGDEHCFPLTLEDGEVKEEAVGSEEDVYEKKHGSHPTFGQEEADSHKKHEHVSAEESCNDDDDDDPDYFEGSPNKSQDLKDPELTTRGEKNFVCDQCKQRFKVKQIMLKHRLKKHGLQIDCEFCELKFLVLAEYRKHFNKEHPTHTCEMCGVKKSDKPSLKRHIESRHTEDQPCHHCGVMFSTKWSLNHHIGRVHGEYKLHQCDKCDFSARVAADVKAHYLRRHTEALNGTCEVCGETFKELKLHLKRTACGGSSKIQCDQCDTTFYSAERLRIHMKKLHESPQVKDKICRYCQYATNSNAQLKRHIASVHKGKTASKMMCPYCHKETKTLEYHIRVYHPEKMADSRD